MRDFVEATNERDGDTFCGELVTQEFTEKATGATGDRAEDGLQQQLELTTGLRAEAGGDRQGPRSTATGPRCGPSIDTTA